MEAVYAAVQREADATKDFGLRELGIFAALTLGIGVILTLVGALQ
ncbi:MAG: hypothetical protein JWR45_3856 [Blastococcus sp.]|jgi:hypothetical protein|nr:hypothetical protein [Blastococcus sp.]